MANRLRLAAAVSGNIDLTRAEQASGASVNVGPGGTIIVTPPGMGSYAAAVLVAHAPTDPAAVMAEIDLAAIDGAAQFNFVSLDMRREIGQPMIGMAGRKEPLRCLIPTFAEAGWLLVRNRNPDGSPTTMVLRDVRFFSAGVEPLPQFADLASDGLGQVDINAMAAAAEAVSKPWAPLDRTEPASIDAVPVELLGERLGYAVPFDPALASRKPLTAWRMEDDDQPIFRYLYRGAQPRRHLEFGTWYGAGTIYCLEESAATVWTINLPDGERRADGSAAYPGDPDALCTASDSASEIGSLYIQAGLGHRVCQIYSDSQLWDTSNYPAGFFDTILIDGGHDAEIVVNDTAKAIPLLRSGGLCLWHDFAPDPSVFAISPATVGVAQGIRDSWPAIRAAMRDIFYIWPSQILVGVKR